MECVINCNSCKEAMTDEEVHHAHQLPVVVGWTVHLIQERWEGIRSLLSIYLLHT